MSHLYKRGLTWWLCYSERSGGKLQTKRCSLGTRERRAAEVEAALIISKAKPEERGKLQELTAGLTIAELLKDYRRDMERRGLTPRHVSQKSVQLSKVCGAVGARGIEDLTSASMSAALDLLDVSARTRNDYRAALCAFFAWLVQSGRWPTNEALAVPVRKELVKTKHRRSMTSEEMAALLGCADVPIWRALCYAVALRMGFRRGTLRDLTWDHVDLTQGIIRLRPDINKGRHDKIKIIPADLLAAWRSWAADPVAELPGRRRMRRQQRITDPLPPVPTVKTFYADLIRAGIPRFSPAGELDFHSTRATCTTTLLQAGVDPATVRDYVDHADVRTTMNYYAKTNLAQHRAAGEALEAAGPSIAQRFEANDDRDQAEDAAA